MREWGSKRKRKEMTEKKRESENEGESKRECGRDDIHVDVIKKKKEKD